jgi:hypothetical protein
MGLLVFKYLRGLFGAKEAQVGGSEGECLKRRLPPCASHGNCPEEDFAMQLLKFLARHQLLAENVVWGVENDTLWAGVLCNDVFAWASSDVEEITEETFPILKQAVADCLAIDQCIGDCHAAMLYCARVRGMRPQGCCYPQERLFWPLFDAAGPEREVSPLNPYRPGQLRDWNLSLQEGGSIAVINGECVRKATREDDRYTIHQLIDAQWVRMYQFDYEALRRMVHAPGAQCYREFKPLPLEQPSGSVEVTE